MIEFQTAAGDSFLVHSIPLYMPTAMPAHLQIAQLNKEQVSLRWNKSYGAVGYNVYTHVGNSPGYKLVQSKVIQTSTSFIMAELQKHLFGVIKIVTVDKTGRESEGIKINVEYQ